MTGVAREKHARAATEPFLCVRLVAFGALLLNRQIDYREGDVVFEEGDAANNFYLVASGNLQVREHAG